MLDYALLEALGSVLRSGSFERAAEQLRITPSAVSQRVKLLEERVGTVLVVRGQPCRPTEAGARLFRHAEDVALMERAALRELPGGRVEHPVTLRIAVNADSLATWFVAAMAKAAREEEGVFFDLVLDDQDHSAEWLRRGEVVAAVTSHAKAVQGCDSRPLGALRYRATASPDFRARWFPKGGEDEAAFQRAPLLTFNGKDRLQALWLGQVFGKAQPGPTHCLPSSQAFVDAALLGLGWGMNPDSLVRGHLDTGRLVELLPERPLDVPLYWQSSRVVASALEGLTRAVLAVGREQLVQG